MSSEIAKRIVKGALMDSPYAPLYPMFESDEDEKDKEPYVWKEPSRIEKIKRRLKEVGEFFVGVLGLILLISIYFAVPFAMASMFAFASGIFWQEETYPFFNLLTFKVAGGILLPPFIVHFISYMVEEWDDIKSGFF